MLGKLAKLLRLRTRVRNWPRVLMDHLRLSRSSYTCRLRNGPVFEIRGGTDDRHVLFEIFVENIYPAPVREGDTVVDIGAQIGCYALRAAGLGARVLAFEPFPANFSALQRNIALNGLSNVRAFQCAVGAEAGERAMFVPDARDHTGRYSLFPGRGSQTVMVPCLSLDQIVCEHRLEWIDVLKIDCQGSEYEILYGASPETLAKIRNIMAECEVFDRPDWSVGALQEYLSTRGFQVTCKDRLLWAHRL